MRIGGEAAERLGQDLFGTLDRPRPLPAEAEIAPEPIRRPSCHGGVILPAELVNLAIARISSHGQSVW
jgi:hypothetical protein